MNRKIVIDGSMLELNPHGSYGFPIQVLRIILSEYPFSSFPLHWHPEFEFFYVTEGSMVCQLNQESVTLEAGDSLFVNSNVLHGGSPNGDDDCKYFVMSVNPRMINGFDNSEIYENYVKSVAESDYFHYCHIKADTDGGMKYGYIMRDLVSYYERKETCWQLQVSSRLQLLWCSIYQQYMSSAPLDVDNKDIKNMQRLKNALTFIYDNYSSQITLDDMAYACHISKSEFCRLFKNTMSQTPFEYLMHFRIQKSLTMLFEDFSITEVASRVGFSGSSYYSEVFRRFMGCSPSEYRKNVKMKAN